MSYRYASKTIFVLGAPRSGTSWLAKIFDAHPDVIYRHEPDIVNRNFGIPFLCDEAVVRKHTRDAEEWFNALARTRRLKCVATSPIFPKSFHSGWQLALRRALITAVKGMQVAPFLRKLANSIDLPDFVDLDSDRWSKLVVKSVSGMGRAGLFAAAAPESRIVVIVRHPCGQVESMLRGVHGSLFEHDIPIDDLAKTEQARRRHLTAEKLNQEPFAAQLAWSWVIQNEMAVEALKASKNVKILRYGDLAEQPEATAKALFQFCNLDWRPEVARFLADSTQGTGRERYYQLKRDPVEADNKWRQRLSPEEIEAIIRVAAQSEVGRLFLAEAARLGVGA